MKRFFLLFLFLTLSVSAKESIDSLATIEKRFNEKDDFYAVVLLDRYLQDREDFHLSLWRVWGELNIDDLESAKSHLHPLINMDSNHFKLNECDQTRAQLIHLYSLYFENQKGHLSKQLQRRRSRIMREIFSQIRNSQCIYQEDRALYEYLSRVVQPSWNQVFSGRVLYGLGYSQNPFYDNNTIKDSDSKFFHRWGTGFGVKPWVENKTIQPHGDLMLQSWYYFPNANQEYHRSTARLKLGAYVLNHLFSFKTYFTGLLLLQKDSLYPEYPISQEQKSLDLDFLLLNKLGFSFLAGSRLFRDSPFSRKEIESSIYLKHSFTTSLLVHGAYKRGSYYTKDSWNQFSKNSFQFSLLWWMHPKIESWNTIAYESRVYNAKNNPRKDRLYLWESSLAYAFYKDFQLNLTYTYYFKKMNRYKEHESAIKQNTKVKDETIAIHLEWNPQFSIQKIPSQKNPSPYLSPWASSFSLKENIDIDSKIEQVEEKFQDRETHMQGGMRCKE